ncbi:MAG TPA: response regulator transcription factor [Gemmatimonadales bacterium]|nr:response regulator transcription factor [Gemmatimonadales bacterium]
MTQISVVIVDDHAVVREGIRRVLEGDPGVRVAAEGADGDAALELVEQHRPDVLVVDVAMSGRTGLAVAAELTRRGVGTRTLVLSMHDQPEYIREARRAGARGYILKDSDPAALRRAVFSVAHGDLVFPPGIEEGSDRATPIDRLTLREREVLHRIASGDTNKEIAARLGISPRTVETHRESLMDKLGIHTVAGLTRLAMEEGLL